MGESSGNKSYEIGGESSLENRLTALKNLAKSYEMRMRGYKLDTASEKWISPKGRKELAGSDFITKTSGMLTSFAEPANLMTTKDKDKFLYEFADAFFKANVMELNDDSIPQENYRAVIKIFKDTFSNIGDIITGAREIYKPLFKNNDNDGSPSYNDFD